MNRSCIDNGPTDFFGRDPIWLCLLKSDFRYVDGFKSCLLEDYLDIVLVAISIGSTASSSYIDNEGHRNSAVISSC